MLVNAQSWSEPNLEEICKVTDCSVIVKSVRDKVLHTFWDEPIMVEVTNCESQFRQFKNGKPLISPTSDVGVMQINQVHWSEAKKLGLDIFYNEDDNIRMGRIVYEKQGVRAWSCYSIVSSRDT